MFSGVAFGDTIIVDQNGLEDFTTIQAAISDPGTTAGDIVIVRPGTYVENITMLGKAITLRSTDPLDGAVVLATIIDGDASGSVITCDSDEDNNTVIDGFLITNGSADYGGGMDNYHSSPTVTNCTFSNNVVSSVGGGAGMANDDGASSVVTNCTFSNNTADLSGGGMYNVYSSPTVTNCTFTNNTAGSDSGGMLNYDAAPTITNCTFSNNSADYGGGMYNMLSSAKISNCTFGNNTAGFGDGGGMYNYDASPLISNCMFSYNSADEGGGMLNDNSSPTVTSCTFSDNSADYGDGGGIYNYDNSSPELVNCTFSDNWADQGGGMYTDSGSPGTPELTGTYFCVNIPDQVVGAWNDNGGNVINDDHCPPPRPIDPEITCIAGDISGDGVVDLVDFAIIADRMKALILIAENWLAKND